MYKTYENFGKRKELKFKNLIHLHFDNTNQQISYSIRDEFIHSVKAVSESYLKLLEMIGGNNDSYPIKFETPVYGQAEPVFTYFMAPGIALRFFLIKIYYVFIFYVLIFIQFFKRSFFHVCRRGIFYLFIFRQVKLIGLPIKFFFKYQKSLLFLN